MFVKLTRFLVALYRSFLPITPSSFFLLPPSSSFFLLRRRILGHVGFTQRAEVQTTSTVYDGHRTHRSRYMVPDGKVDRNAFTETRRRIREGGGDELHVYDRVVYGKWEAGEGDAFYVYDRVVHGKRCIVRQAMCAKQWVRYMIYEERMNTARTHVCCIRRL